MITCTVCKNEINDGAKKCTHCGEYQNYRRYLKFPQNALVLLIALISVSSVLTPILRTSNTSVITDLYFGKDTPTGSVSDIEWKNFKDSVISKSFYGYTELDASGFWTSNDGSIVNENTSIVRIIHDNSSQELDKINDIIILYKDRFEQESVLQTQSYDSQIDFK